MDYAAYSTATWYADGLRWVATLITRVADRLDTPPESPAPSGERYSTSAEERIAEIRHRVTTHYY